MIFLVLQILFHWLPQNLLLKCTIFILLKVLLTLPKLLHYSHHQLQNSLFWSLLRITTILFLRLLIRVIVINWITSMSKVRLCVFLDRSQNPAKSFGRKGNRTIASVGDSEFTELDHYTIVVTMQLVVNFHIEECQKIENFQLFNFF